MTQANLSLMPATPNTLFDYAALDRETEVEARSDAALIKGLMRRTAEDVIEIGKALIRQQKALNRRFQSWIELEFEMSQSAAYRFINVAERFDPKHPTVGRLPLAALYELAAPSTPPEVREEVERRIAAGELVSGVDVRTLKAQYDEVAAKALDLARVTDEVREENRDLVATAYRQATQEAERKYGEKIGELTNRVESLLAAAASSIKANEPGANVLPFAPKDDGEPIKDPDPLTAIEGDDPDNVDITNARFGAHAVYTALSTIDLAQTTPEDFWAIFNTPHLKTNAEKWLRAASRKIAKIKKGMPK
jgi:hypothetical protein